MLECVPIRKAAYARLLSRTSHRENGICFRIGKEATVMKNSEQRISACARTACCILASIALIVGLVPSNALAIEGGVVL